MTNEKFTLIFFDVDGVLNNYYDHQLLHNLKNKIKTIKLELHNLQQDFADLDTKNLKQEEYDMIFNRHLIQQNQLFKTLNETEKELKNKFLIFSSTQSAKKEELGFVEMEKLSFLQDLHYKNNAHTFLISSWGAFNAVNFCKKQDLEYFFNIPLSCNGEGCTFDADIRLNFVCEQAFLFAERNYVHNLKNINVIYIDDMSDFNLENPAIQQLKKDFEESFNVIYVHPKNDEPLNSNLHKLMLSKHNINF